jgi:hypothetical protein
MGSQGRKNRSPRTPKPTQRQRNVPEPPGGLPGAGEGYEPDPLSPVGTWIQSSRFIDGLGRRLGRRVMTVILVSIAVLFVFTLIH